MQANLNNKFKWINKDLVNKIIENDNETKDEKCHNFTLSNVCAEGENFVSYLVKLEVFFQRIENSEKDRKKYVIKIINRESRFGKFVDLGMLMKFCILVFICAYFYIRRNI